MSEDLGKARARVAETIAKRVMEWRGTPQGEPAMEGRELLEVVAMKQLRGKKVPGRWLNGLSDEQKRLWHELSMVPAMMLQDKLIEMGLKSRDPRVLNVAWDAARDVKDRVLGKATERIQIAQAVRVEVGGIDLGQLPGGGDPQSGQEGEPPSGGE